MLGGVTDFMSAKQKASQGDQLAFFLTVIRSRYLIEELLIFVLLY
jgi:hypothetical protein